ncbi:MAG: hypothetical protein NZ700_13530 [Gemmataceae bacterium]|nr:hypothetical protein [Gemmataceae bacterium]MDW8265340.1 hypothetical protein [Gemmataceae bacterium]
MVVAGLVLGLVAAEPQASIRVREIEGPTRIEIIGTLPPALRDRFAEVLSPEEGENVLRLTLLDPETGREGLPVLGVYRRAPEGLSFTPRHALSPGHRYRVTLRRDAQPPVVHEFEVPAAKRGEPATVEAIYPTADVLPANLLKFYVHFSRPMRESREIFDQIRLVDDTGRAVPEPWRRLELWSADNRRLTLFIHPGRIKQGVNLREEEGPVLRPNRRYTLEIGAEVLDADGQPLGKLYRKTFRTGPEEHRRPLPQEWRVQAPAAGTCRPLVVEFPRPLDRALLGRCLTVHAADGRPVAGTISVEAAERRWLFVPAQEWQAAEYHVRIDAVLEDLAGNTPERVFDLDLTQPVGPPPQWALPFRPQ